MIFYVLLNPNLKKITTFAKNTAYIERFLLNYSYLCNVVLKYDKHIEDAFSAVPSAESGQFNE